LNFTPQQQALFDAVGGRRENVAVSAVAGAGKTTSAVGSAKAARPGTRTGFVAFNKHIAQELQRKLGDLAMACTLHSLGFAAVRRRFGSVELDEQKPKRLLERIRPRWCFTTKAGRVLWYDEGQAALEIARLAKLTLTNEHDAAALENLADYYGVDLPKLEADRRAVYAAVAELVEAGAANTSIIDYDDMIWLPVRLGLAPERYDLLLVDEVQDLSLVQHALVRLAGERLVVVGDERQSLYGFTGADPESMPRLIKDLSATPAGLTSCPLTVTFRCPRSHVDVARQIVSHIEAAPAAIDGTVAEVDPEAPLWMAKPGDLVVCRKNAPLVQLAFKFIKAGVPAVMLGRDFAKGLTGLVDHLKAADTTDLIRRLDEWRDREVEKLERRDAPASRTQAIHDKVECLIELASTVPTVTELRSAIGRLFADAADPSRVITLSSVHRAKGSEAGRVFILEPDCMPMTSRKSRPWEVQQEMNVLYVAVTRAKRELYFCGPTHLDVGRRARPLAASAA